MKKLILILLATIAFSCGDGSNRSSEAGSETEDTYSREPMEADTTDMQSDTTSSPGMDQGNEVDTTSNSDNL